MNFVKVSYNYGIFFSCCAWLELRMPCIYGVYGTIAAAEHTLNTTHAATPPSSPLQCQGMQLHGSSCFCPLSPLRQSGPVWPEPETAIPAGSCAVTNRQVFRCWPLVEMWSWGNCRSGGFDVWAVLLECQCFHWGQGLVESDTGTFFQQAQDSAIPHGTLGPSSPCQAPWGRALPWAIAAKALCPPPSCQVQEFVQPPPPHKTQALMPIAALFLCFHSKEAVIGPSLWGRTLRKMCPKPPPPRPGKVPVSSSTDTCPEGMHTGTAAHMYQQTSNHSLKIPPLTSVCLLSGDCPSSCSVSSFSDKSCKKIDYMGVR
jgi:hypothetical protein